MFELMYFSFYLEYGPDKYKRILCNSLCRGAEVLDLHPGRLSWVRRTGFESVGSKERIWSPPVICHILCCWWQKRSESHKSETHLVSHEKNELCWVFLAPTPLIMWVEKSNSGRKKKEWLRHNIKSFKRTHVIFEARVERQRSEGNTRKHFLPLQIQVCDPVLVLLKLRCLWTVECLIHLFYPRAYIESYLPWKFYTVIQLCPKCNLKTWLILCHGLKKNPFNS